MDRKPEQPAPAKPEGHWYSTDPAEPRYEEVISPHRAVQDAIAELGCDASTEDLRRFLEARGFRADPALIERVKAESVAGGQCP